MSGFRRAFGMVKRSAPPSAVKVDPAQILGALPVAVVMLDENDAFCFVNYAAEEFFGSSATLLKNQQLSRILPVDHPIFLLLERARTNGLTVAEHDMVLEGPRLSRRGTSVQVAPMGDVPGHLVMTLHDESAARALDQQMSARNAARSITGMAAILAHEVKNPLSGIRGAAQLLETSVPPNDRELAVLIREEADRIRAMVERMETFGEKKLERNAVNIHRVLERMSANWPVPGLRQADPIYRILRPVIAACERQPRPADPGIAEPGEKRRGGDCRHGTSGWRDPSLDRLSAWRAAVRGVWPRPRQFADFCFACAIMGPGSRKTSAGICSSPLSAPRPAAAGSAWRWSPKSSPIMAA